eukprot:332640-Pelagomonas_calceolata.AAC.5
MKCVFYVNGPLKWECSIGKEGRNWKAVDEKITCQPEHQEDQSTGEKGGQGWQWPSAHGRDIQETNG